MNASVVALGAASGFAVSTSLQHRAASGVPAATGAVRLVLRLARTPLWLAASTLGLVSFGLHAVALHLGSLALVQPLMLGGVVLAVPVRAALSRRLPPRAELLAVLLTVASLGCFLAATHLSPGVAAPTTGRALFSVATAALVFAGLMLLAYRQGHPVRRSGLLGAGAGVVFGLMAGLIKLLAHELTTVGLWSTLGGWLPWVLLLAGFTAVTTNQRAFHASHLAASMPVLNVVNVLVAMVIGWFVFGEAPVQGPLSLAVQVVSATGVVAGLVWIARLDPAPHEEEPVPAASPCPPRAEPTGRGGTP